MSDQSTILSLPYILPAQAQKHVTHNEALRLLDVIVQLSVLARDLALPPTTAVQGDRYIVPMGAQGDWAQNQGHIALYQDGAWQFFAPNIGWTAWVAAESVLASYDGATWIAAADVAQTFGQLGISASADAINRLVVSSPATLFNHDGAGHQVKINKAAAGDTASLLFQTGFSGRAEMGTAGHDDFAIKVSADGNAFLTGLSIAGQTGQVTLPAALRLGGQAADPVAPADGTIWLNSTTGQVKVRSNGVDVILASVAGLANAQLADMASATIKGRAASGTGAPQDLTPETVTALLPTVTSTTKGLAPASGGGAVNFLRADGVWAAPSGGSVNLTSLGITATAAQINALSYPQSGYILAGDPAWNLATTAPDVGNNAVWNPNPQNSSQIVHTKTASGIDSLGRPWVEYTVNGQGGTGWVFPMFQSYAPIVSQVGDHFTASAIVELKSGNGGGVWVGAVARATPGGPLLIQKYTLSTPVLGGGEIITQSTLTDTTGAFAELQTLILIKSDINAAHNNAVYRITSVLAQKGAARAENRTAKFLSPAEARVALGLPWLFTSSFQTITNGSTLTVAHGLGAKPTNIRVTMVCVTADLGYAVGDEIDVPFLVTNVAYGAIASAGASNITIRTAANGILLMNASWAFAQATSASWRYIVRASL